MSDKLKANQLPIRIYNSVEEADLFRLSASNVSLDDYFNVRAWGALMQYDPSTNSARNFDFAMYISENRAGEGIGNPPRTRRVSVPDDNYMSKGGQRRYWSFDMNLRVAYDSIFWGSTFLVSSPIPQNDNDIWKNIVLSVSPGIARGRVDHKGSDFDVALRVKLSRANPLIGAECWGAILS